MMAHLVWWACLYFRASKRVQWLAFQSGGSCRDCLSWCLHSKSIWAMLVTPVAIWTLKLNYFGSTLGLGQCLDWRLTMNSWCCWQWFGYWCCFSTSGRQIWFLCSYSMLCWYLSQVQQVPRDSNNQYQWWAKQSTRSEKWLLWTFCCRSSISF